MGWSLGYDARHERDIGYGVPAYCDHPGCTAEIDRGLGYVCCGEQPYGGEDGCGLYFCGDHADCDGMCERCANPDKDGNVWPFDPKPDHPKWVLHKLTDASWAAWRVENPEWVRAATSTPTPDSGATP